MELGREMKKVRCEYLKLDSIRKTRPHGPVATCINQTSALQRREEERSIS